MCDGAYALTLNGNGILSVTYVCVYAFHKHTTYGQEVLISSKRSVLSLQMKWHYVIQVLTQGNEIQNVVQVCNNSLLKSIYCQLGTTKKALTRTLSS